MKLHPDTDLIFVRRSGEIIAAHAGLEFDGASIPPLFWLLLGSPFTGKYRKAAVIHDTLCYLRDRSSAEAHFVFFECARALGVGRFRAWCMYKALMIGGSKW
jgi:endonuclease G